MEWWLVSLVGSLLMLVVVVGPYIVLIIAIGFLLGIGLRMAGIGENKKE